MAYCLKALSPCAEPSSSFKDTADNFFSPGSFKDMKKNSSLKQNFKILHHTVPLWSLPTLHHKVFKNHRISVLKTLFWFNGKKNVSSQLLIILVIFVFLFCWLYFCYSKLFNFECCNSNSVKGRCETLQDLRIWHLATATPLAQTTFLPTQCEMWIKDKISDK